MRKRAMGYSDFYKNNENTPDSEEENQKSNIKPVTNIAKERAAAIKRRLAKRKAGL